MKYILKDNKKFIITNALFEKINQNQQGSLTVNPNINNVVNKPSQQDKTLGNETQTNNQFDENNISDIFKKKWNINLDEEIKHTIIDYSNSLENRLVSLNKKIINFLSKKYPELQDSFSKLDIKEKIINELNTNEVNIHIKKALLQWFKNSNMNINNIYKDFNKSYPSGEKNINYDIVIRELPTAIKGGIANYLIEKLKETHVNTLKNSREIDNEDINHIIKAIIKEIGAGIFNKPGNMGDVMNIENIEKSENKDKIWEKFKSMFNELKKMNISSYDDVYKELINQNFDMEILDTIKNDMLVQEALKANYTEYQREVVAKAKEPTILENGVILTKKMATKADKKLLGVFVGFFDYNELHYIAIKLKYEKFDILEIFILT